MTSCSSADLNPIGAISKRDLKSFISWAANNFDMPILEEFIHATRTKSITWLGHKTTNTNIATAELEPITENYVQSDEGK